MTYLKARKDGLNQHRGAHGAARDAQHILPRRKQRDGAAMPGESLTPDRLRRSDAGADVARAESELSSTAATGVEASAFVDS